MDLQDEQIGDGFDLGLDIGMDMPEVNRERQLSGSLTGSYGRQAGGVSSSGYGGIQIDVEDLEPLDLGLDTGMEGWVRCGGKPCCRAIRLTVAYQLRSRGLHHRIRTSETRS